MLIPPAGFLFIEFLGWNASRAHSWQDKESVVSWEEGVAQVGGSPEPQPQP